MVPPLRREHRDFIPTFIDRYRAPALFALPNADDAGTCFSGPIGFEQWLFECPKCDHVEISVTASDPFKSKVIGWLAGELGTPN
jgi:hypothetical protein